jgi:RNA polymerase sigma-70 factor (ECF subfamily)
MSDPTDPGLIARCQQGDEQAFRELVDHYKNLVFAVVARSTADPARVEDIAQEVFLRIHRGLPYFRGDAKLTTWIYRIVLNLLSQESERRRGRSREISLDPEIPAHEPRALDRAMNDLELHDRLEKAMARLPPNYRLLIAGHYLQDVKYEDLAEALGMPVGTVKTHLHRAKKQLRALLETDLR